MKWFQRPGTPAIVGTFLGLIGGWASQLVTQDQGLQLALGLLTGIATLQIGELLQLHARTPLVAKLEEALTDPELYHNIERIITANARLNDRKAAGPRYGFLFQERLDKVLDDAAQVMEELAAGRLVVSDPDQQYKFSIDLVASARKSVKAVSFRDEEFWDSEAGKRYLSHNERLLRRRLPRRRGVVSRIFVLDSHEIIAAMRPTIDRHIALGVTVYIMPPAAREPSDLEDFVVYDDQYVRFAEPLEFAGSKKRATLSVHGPDVVKYSSKFEQMVLRSLPAKEYFAVRDGGQQSLPHQRSRINAEEGSRAGD
jgi:hypothetical protein